MLQGLGLYFVPLLCGYWLLTHCNFTKFRSIRESGYHILFRSAIAGLGLYLLANLVMQIVEYFCPVNCVFLTWESLVPIENSVTLTFTVFFALVLPLILNYFYDEIEAARIVAKQNGDFIELLIDQSINRELLVELSLHSGKCYVGYVIESQLLRQSEADIVLVPIMSGYRKNETRELEITTHYSSIILEFDKKEIDDFGIAIPMSQIISARLFDEEVYSHFQKQSSVPTLNQIKSIN